ADVPNLSNIQFGIPIQPNGFSMPLNNAALFQNMPPGIYQVSAVAQCGNGYTGRNTWIQVPGAYESPLLSLELIRNSLNCGNYGALAIDIDHGRPPFTINITSAPAGYAGPSSFSSSFANFPLHDLPTGSYTIQ